MSKRDDHFDFIAQLPCVCCGREPVQVCHVRMSDARFDKKNAMAKKNDNFVLSMCPECHDKQHRRGERKWWASRNIDAPLLAHKLKQVSGDVEAGRQICFHALRYGWR